MKYNKKQFILLFSAPILCMAMLILMPFLTNEIGKTQGYIMGFIIYWFVFCLPISIYSFDGFSNIIKLYFQKLHISIRMKNIYYLLAFIPCIATFFVVFRRFAFKAGFEIFIIVFLFALINGTVEELFWRGAFNKNFDNNIILAYIYPTVFFGIWHIALYFAKGIDYQGGFSSLVGGSFFMGILWGWIAYKTKSIRVVTLAHITTNFFAFTGLIFENWYM